MLTPRDVPWCAGDRSSVGGTGTVRVEPGPHPAGITISHSMVTEWFSSCNCVIALASFSNCARLLPLATPLPGCGFLWLSEDPVCAAAAPRYLHWTNRQTVRHSAALGGYVGQPKERDTACTEVIRCHLDEKFELESTNAATR